MAADEDREKAAARPDDVIAAVLEDHADITTMMNDLSVASEHDAREAAFARLVTKLAVHETAEEEVLHPLARHVGHSQHRVDERLEEESKGKTALAELEHLGVDAPEFDAKFQALRGEVLAHADKEERYELSTLDQWADEEQLARAASLFRAAQRMAPTRAHGHSPESATGNVVLGPFVAVADRTRDAIRKLMHGPTR